MWQRIGLCLISIMMVTVGFSLGIAIESGRLECECFNKNNSDTKTTADKCDANNRIVCKGSREIAACFALWETNNDTGEYAHTLSMKGCFRHSASCSNTECVDSSEVERVEKQGVNFCCCTGNLCNSKYSWEPRNLTTTNRPSCTKTRNKCHFDFNMRHCGFLLGYTLCRHLLI